MAFLESSFPGAYWRQSWAVVHAWKLEIHRVWRCPFRSEPPTRLCESQSNVSSLNREASLFGQSVHPSCEDWARCGAQLQVADVERVDASADPDGQVQLRSAYPTCS